MTPCAGCHAPIRWVKTRADTAMPCDPELLAVWVTETPQVSDQRMTLTAPDGEQRTGYLATAATAGASQIDGYVSHFSTCPHSAQFRRAKV